MRPAQVASLVSIRAPKTRRADRVLARCHTIDDVRTACRRRLPRAVFDYVDGGADDEVSLARNVAAFDRREFRPRALVDVSAPDTTTSVLGDSLAAPIGLAPTGYTRMVGSAGESGVAHAAATAGLPYVLSTMATTSLADVRDGSPGANLWFQLYLLRDRVRARALIDQAQVNGYGVLELAVDTAVSGRRVRDVRSGFTIPPALRMGTLLDIGRRPAYWTRMLRSPALRFANLDGDREASTIEDLGALFDPGISWHDVEALRRDWPGKLLLKGPIVPADAKRAQSIGVDGVHLSNHGGRQLDRTVAPLELVAPVRSAVGADFTVLLDSGVRHGADVAIGVAAGADACFVGRPYLWGLGAAGERGVAHVIDLLVSQFRRTMQLLGVRSVRELREHGAELVR